MSLTDAAVTDASVDALQARIAAAAPAPLVDKMRSAKLTGERKPVTALFADVVGSTTLAERMDPEDWTQMMNEAFDLMSRAIFRYEGTIAQLQGDALLAFFGAPVAHEDDPERAVRAALEMINDTDEFARQLRLEHDIEFQIRAGINTGPVIVGNVGSDLRYEYTALGDAVNVAARVQTAAATGTAVISDRTHRFVTNAFDFEDLGEVELKGKSEPVRLYRVLGLRAEPGPRRGLDAVGLSSPLVGRSAELGALVDAYSVVKAGRGRVAIVTGEPGLGKSRLLSELRASVTATAMAEATADSTSEGSDTDQPGWVEGHCVSYGRSVPYHLILDLVRSMLGVPVGASDGETRQALTATLARVMPDEAGDIEPYLAHLLAVPLSSSEADVVQIDPEVMQGRYVSSVKRLVTALAANRPLVIVLEDIHWADPASVDVTLGLIPLVTPQRVLVLLVARAETDVPGWRLVSQIQQTYGAAVTEVRLQPLTEDEARALVSNLLEIESLPEQVRAKILDRSEGNPFFVEEVIRMFIERGAIVRENNRWVATDSITGIEIPDTLHGLLLARIDQLPEDAKRSLRVAAVIGRQFPVRVLERVLADG